MEPQTTDPADPANDPADAIANALSRLRGPRRGGPGGMGRGPHGARRGLGPQGFGPHGPGPHGQFGGGPRGEDWAAPERGAGAPAIVRMLEALATADAPLSVSEIGEAIGVDQPRASRLVKQGAARDLVRREADPEDARRTRIALTEAGRRFASGLRGRRRESLARALEGFSEAEQRELARLLGKLADNWPGRDAS
ncbi:MarR family winged helix-turn-helix transcriptional regulator [Leucobacter sp.]